jgi:hypothetical protein
MREQSILERKDVHKGIIMTDYFSSGVLPETFRELPGPQENWVLKTSCNMLDVANTKVLPGGGWNASYIYIYIFI